MRIRNATPADLDTIMSHRRRMFIEMGFTETNDRIVAGGGVVIGGVAWRNLSWRS